MCAIPHPPSPIRGGGSVYATVEIMLTIVPPPRSNICGRTARCQGELREHVAFEHHAQVVLVGVEELLHQDGPLVDTVVDEHVDPPEPLHRGVDRVEQRLPVEHVEPDRETGRALGFDRGDRRVEAPGDDDRAVGLPAAVAVVHRPGADDDVEAAPGEVDRGGLADPPARPGHQCDRTLFWHGGSPPIVTVRNGTGSTATLTRLWLPALGACGAGPLGPYPPLAPRSRRLRRRAARAPARLWLPGPGRGVVRAREWVLVATIEDCIRIAPHEEPAMPAVTVENPLTLPVVAQPDPASRHPRPVVSVTTAPRGTEGLGFPVRRVFAGVDQGLLDPFVHMDQMGEVEYGPGQPKGTPWHPHRGFETVTYIIDGAMQHQDSNGGGGLITDGATQWMTAGSGILHIETPPEALVATGGLFHGIQLWVNLPAAEKWAAPRYQSIEGDQVVLLRSPDGGALVRVIAGDVDNASGPGVTHTPIALAHATLNPGAELALPWPEDFNALVYALSGRGFTGADRRPLHSGQLAVFGPGNEIVVSADVAQESQSPNFDVLILGGHPIGEPVALVRTVRDEHRRRDRPGPQRLPGGPHGHHTGAPPRRLTEVDGLASRVRWPGPRSGRRGRGSWISQGVRRS